VIVVIRFDFIPVERAAAPAPHVESILFLCFARFVGCAVCVHWSCFERTLFITVVVDIDTLISIFVLSALFVIRWLKKMPWRCDDANVFWLVPRCCISLFAGFSFEWRLLSMCEGSH
jgi:hypothetical protein